MSGILSRFNSLRNIVPRDVLTPFSVISTRTVFNENDRSTVSILNEDEEAGLLISSYSKAGFRFNNGMVAIGPIALFPRTVLSWNVASPSDITVESLSLFCQLEPKIDILVIGVGDAGSKVDLKVIQYMRSKKISLEILSTERACATFNFLNVENRCVAGALIPPTKIRFTEDDITSSRISKRNLLAMDD